MVKMILSSYGSDEPPEKFVLVESLSDSEGNSTQKVESPVRGKENNSSRCYTSVSSKDGSVRDVAVLWQRRVAR